MSEKENDPIAVALFIEQQKELNRIKDDVTKLIKEDLGLDHKMDMLMTEQRLLKERVEEGVSKTAYKTYEMVNQIFTQIKDMSAENKMRDHKIGQSEKQLDWIIRGFVIVMVSGMLLAVWKLKN